MNTYISWWTKHSFKLSIGLIIHALNMLSWFMQPTLIYGLFRSCCLLSFHGGLLRDVVTSQTLLLLNEIRVARIRSRKKMQPTLIRVLMCPWLKFRYYNLFNFASTRFFLYCEVLHGDTLHLDRLVWLVLLLCLCSLVTCECLTSVLSYHCC
jgi:hypothetical protein